MRSVVRLQAIRNDVAFRSIPYILEARGGSLVLIPLPRRWLISSNLALTLVMVPVLLASLSTAQMIDRAEPAAILPVGIAYSLFVILMLIKSAGWSQRLAWRLLKPTRERILHPEIKDIKIARFHSTLMVETKEGAMTFVVQARSRTITEALELASKPA